jgi:ssDNA-specific exonuclease RecJ
MLNAAAAYESFKCGNDTDKATLSRVTPSRGEFSNIYKQLKEAKKLRIAELYERNAHDINYFKLRLILDIFGEARLCTVDLRNGIVYNTDNPNKADLSATVTMKRLT